MMRRILPVKTWLVAGLSVALGWGAARTLYSQNTDTPPAQPAAPAEPAADAAKEVASATAVEDPLGDLGWLTGDWVEEGDEPGVEFHGRWTGTGAFLVRSFRVALDEESTLPGLQVIGWDPNAKQVRSWTFDGTGGFGEEVWSRLEETWTIRSKYTLPNGKKAGSINVLTRLDDNSFTWKSVNRDVDGEMQPDVDEFTVVRAQSAVGAPPAPGTPIAPAATVPGTPVRPTQPAQPARPGTVVPPAPPAAPARPLVPGVPQRPGVPRQLVPGAR
ncbi:MAG: hypothetical protein ACKOGA_14035 [Planctomycetaceae bacterium]